MLTRSIARPTTLLRAVRLLSTPAPSATTTTTAKAMSSTISEVVTHDHAELKDYYNKILSGPDADTKIRWQNQFVWELARHSVGEEIVVYPAMEKYVPDGKKMTDQDRAEHQSVRFPSVPLSPPTQLTRYAGQGAA